MTDHTYTVHELAQLSGVSVRTLHHYDQCGLLVPARRDNGYRAYDGGDVRRLQLIMLYRACGMGLARIAELLDDPHISELDALELQLSTLQERRDHLDATISTVCRTIEALREETIMTDRERFEGLKREAIERNERTYGAEARKRWGDEAVDRANEALAALDEEAWNSMQALEEQIKLLLADAMADGDVTGAKARTLVAAHARWLQLHWGPGAYTPEAHRGLADGYLADERFQAYYDGACGAGATQFLHDAIHALA